MVQVRLSILGHMFIRHATTPGKVQHSHPFQGTMRRLSAITGATGLPRYCPSPDINSAVRLW